MLILIMQGVYSMDVPKHASSNLPVVRCRKDIQSVEGEQRKGNKKIDKPLLGLADFWWRAADLNR